MMSWQVVHLRRYGPTLSVSIVRATAQRQLTAIFIGRELGRLAFFSPDPPVRWKKLHGTARLWITRRRGRAPVARLRREGDRGVEGAATVVGKLWTMFETGGGWKESRRATHRAWLAC